MEVEAVLEQQDESEDSRRVQRRAKIKEVDTVVTALKNFQADGAVSALVKEREEELAEWN